MVEFVVVMLMKTVKGFCLLHHPIQSSQKAPKVIVISLRGQQFVQSPIVSVNYKTSTFNSRRYSPLHVDG